MSEWTPGPWVAVNERDVDTRDGHCIAIMGVGVDEFEANAHLIAAAPDLYEALERVLSAHKARCEWPADDTTKRFDAMLKEVEWAEEAALAALAKARGEAQ